MDRPQHRRSYTRTEPIRRSRCSAANPPAIPHLVTTTGPIEFARNHLRWTRTIARATAIEHAHSKSVDHRLLQLDKMRIGRIRPGKSVGTNEYPLRCTVCPARWGSGRAAAPFPVAPGVDGHSGRGHEDGQKPAPPNASPTGPDDPASAGSDRSSSPPIRSTPHRVVRNRIQRCSLTLGRGEHDDRRRTT